MTFLIIGIIIAICVGLGYDGTDSGENGSMPTKLGGDDKDF
jgi:hypothetical protein